MNENSNDHPDFTAYALGEASLEQSTRVRRRLAEDPDARADFDQLQKTIDALQQVPAPPRRALNPRQRETVLAMSQLKTLPPAALKTLRPMKRHQHPGWQVAKLAAAACVALGAFFVGQKFATPSSAGNSKMTVATESSSGETDIPPPSSSLRMETDHTPRRVDDIPPQVAMQSNFEAIAEKAVLPQPPLQQPPASALVPESAEKIAVTSTDAAKTPDAKVEVSGQAAPAKNPAAKSATSMVGFVMATDKTSSVFEFKPNSARRLPQANGLVLASPPPVNSVQQSKKTGKNLSPQPALQFHSWKAEAASCPWDTGRRLMRLVIQVPVNQAAFEVNEAPYTMQASFDSSLVKGYRMVAEKHIRPGADRNLSTRIVWYEFIPTEKFKASEQNPATIGEFKVLQPQGHKDGASNDGALALVDRGTAWEEAREDFIFETSMVGFGLLLQGKENIGALNHDLVLNLAEHSSSEPPKGERASFIQTVEQARNAAGL